MSKSFNLTSSYDPAGDQPKAINELIEGLDHGLAAQTLLGVTAAVSYTHLTLPTTD